MIVFYLTDSEKVCMLYSEMLIRFLPLDFALTEIHVSI